MQVTFAVPWIGVHMELGVSALKVHEFTLILATNPSEAKADRLYGICQDGTIGSNAGVGYVRFHREARSLESALRSALADVRAAGLRAKRVEMEPNSLLLTT